LCELTQAAKLHTSTVFCLAYSLPLIITFLFFVKNFCHSQQGQAQGHPKYAPLEDLANEIAVAMILFLQLCDSVWQ